MHDGVEVPIAGFWRRAGIIVKKCVSAGKILNIEPVIAIIVGGIPRKGIRVRRIDAETVIPVSLDRVPLKDIIVAKI